MANVGQHVPMGKRKHQLKIYLIYVCIIYIFIFLGYPAVTIAIVAFAPSATSAVTRAVVHVAISVCNAPLAGS